MQAFTLLTQCSFFTQTMQAFSFTLSTQHRLSHSQCRLSVSHPQHNTGFHTLNTMQAFTTLNAGLQFHTLNTTQAFTPSTQHRLSHSQHNAGFHTLNAGFQLHTLNTAQAFTLAIITLATQCRFSHSEHNAGFHTLNNTGFHTLNSMQAFTPPTQAFTL